MRIKNQRSSENCASDTKINGLRSMARNDRAKIFLTWHDDQTPINFNFPYTFLQVPEEFVFTSQNTWQQT